MFVGHALLALAIAGLGAYALGWPRERALLLGLFSGVVATLPDVDMLYALTGVIYVGSLDPIALAEGFWGASEVVHRSMTHSLVVSVPVAAGIALLSSHRRRRWLGYGLLAAVLITLTSTVSTASQVVLFAFILGAGILGRLAARVGIEAIPAGVAAGIGLLTHPFGDLFTGSAPALFYPFDIHLIESRMVIAADPTLHLLGAFFIELAAIWAGLAAFSYLHQLPIRAHLRPRAALGGAYAAAALVIPAPTMDLSYPFVFSIVSVGFIGVVPERIRILDRAQIPDRTTILIPNSMTPSFGRLSNASKRTILDRTVRSGDRSSGASEWWTALVTGLATVTVAGVAYAIAYVSSQVVWPL